MLPRTVSVLGEFPFSQTRTGVTYMALHPVSWSEPTVFERRFVPGVPPEEAAGVAGELVHQDFAYVFEAYWDLWTLEEGTQKWTLAPSLVRFITQGSEFEEQASQSTGHVQIDFGLDAAFLHEGISLVDAEDNVRKNIQKLVAFTAKLEKNAGATGRLLWSESEENLAQKLISRLQRVQ